MKLIFVTLFLFLGSGEYVMAQDSSEPSRARFGVGIMYQSSDNMGIFRNEGDRNNRRDVTHIVTHQGSIMLDYYVNRFFFINTNISIGHRNEYQYRGGVARASIADSIIGELGTTMNGRMPIGNFFAFTLGVGWYFNTPLSYLGGVHERFSGSDNFHYNTGMLLRVGMDIGSMRSGSVYAPLGFEARFDVMNGFLYGFYLGLGFRI